MKVLVVEKGVWDRISERVKRNEHPVVNSVLVVWAGRGAGSDGQPKYILIGYPVEATALPSAPSNSEG